MRKLATAILMAGAPVKDADLRYACGFTAPDPVLFLKTARKRVLVVNAMEVARARRTARGVEVVTPAEMDLTPEETRALSGWAIGLLRREKLTGVSVGHLFPLGLARRLEQAGVAVRVSEAPLCPGREIKRPDEIAAIRACQRAAVAAVARAVRELSRAEPDARGVLRLDGRVLTADRLRRLMRMTLLERDCAGPDLIVACGAQGADPHETGHGPLRANASIVLDVFPQHLGTGYWGDLTRTVVRGTAAPRLKAMHRAVRAAQEAVLRAIRPGAHGARLHALAVRELEARGFRTEERRGRPVGFIHGTGHGVGLEIHEGPSLSTRDAVLRAGHVVTVEPGLYYPETGAVRIEDTVVVTRTGCEVLAACPKRLECGPRQ